jgi:chemotaxis protein CheX
MKDNSIAQGDISGIIGFADRKLSGSVALSFPINSVLKIYSMMMGESVSRINPDVQDSVGELANIIAGTAKKEFDEIDVQFHISIPTVVVGNNHTITHKAGTPVVVVPFKMDGDVEFTLEISMKLER